MEMFYCVAIIYPIPYKINNYWYNLVDLISSLFNENNGYVYALIWGHIKRVYNNRSEDVKFEKLSRVICLIERSSVSHFIVFTQSSVGPDQNAASDQGLHCLSFTQQLQGVWQTV